MLLHRIYLTFIAVIVALVPQAAMLRHGGSYENIFQLPADSAMAIGERYLMHNQPDSALLYYDIVVKRYDTEANPDQSRLLVEAYIREWSIYFGFYYDYYRSYESLYKAGEVCATAGITDARINFYLGGMYQTIFEQSGDKGVADTALDYFTKAYSEAIDTNNDNIADLSFMNIASLTGSTGEFSVAEKLWESYAKLTIGDNKIRHYNHLWYTGLKSLNDKQYPDAIKQFNELLGAIPQGIYAYRLHYMATLSKSKALAASGRVDEAIALITAIEGDVEASELKDIQLDIFKTLAHYHDLAGNRIKHNKYHAHYLELKDTLLNYQQLTSLNRLNFDTRLREAGRRIEDMERSRQLHEVVLWAVALFALLILAFAVVIYRKNRRLSSANEVLYRKTREMLEQSNEQERKSRTQRAVHEMKDAATFERISNAFENSDDIYSQSFTIAKFSELTGIPDKEISQIVNERWNANFNSVLNGYRVRRACRLLEEDCVSRRSTIEAVACSVGFRSRSSFIEAFKRVTGLTPSEFQKEARARHEKGEKRADDNTDEEV